MGHEELYDLRTDPNGSQLIWECPEPATEGQFDAHVAPEHPNASCLIASATSPNRTKTVVTNATIVIKMTARHNRSSFVAKSSFTPLQLRSVCIDRSVESAQAGQVRNRSSDGPVQKPRADRFLF